MPELRGFKFITILILVFKKNESEDKTKYDNFYSSSKTEMIINESDIDDVFQSIITNIQTYIHNKPTLVTNTQKSLGKGSGWVIDSVIEYNISILRYKPLARSSYIKLRKELKYSREGLTNIQDIDDNECFK